ncbi:MAG: gas vesicle protein GvpJ [Dehalococcoidia bacterium]
MEPTRDTHYTLVDLLDRVLDKGIVIHADVIVSVAGIPLIGVNLRAAIAGMETMLRYGMMQPWDEQVRAWERKERQQRKEALIQGEQVVTQTVGSYYHSQGIYRSWRWGYLYLTDTRLFLWLPSFEEVVFETPLDQIKAMSLVAERESFNKHNHDALHLLLDGGRMARLRALEATRLKEAIQEKTAALGVTLGELVVRPKVEEGPARVLSDGEEIACSGKMWHLVPGDLKGSDTVGTWRPGHLYLTNERLCWWNDFTERMALDVPLQELKAVALETKSNPLAVRERSVLDIVYDGQHGKEVASLSGQQLDQWVNALNRSLSGQGVDPAPSGTEACPRCGQEEQVQKLLAEGCGQCGWMSPRSQAAASRVATLPKAIGPLTAR